MKKYISILALAVLMIACKKESNTAKNGGGGSAPQSVISQMESCLTGTWTFDSTCYYSAGTIIQTQITQANMKSHVFSSAPYSTAANNGSKKLLTYDLGMSNTTWWQVDTMNYSYTDKYTLTSPGAQCGGYIILLQGNQLVISDNYATVRNGYYKFFHK